MNEKGTGGRPSKGYVTLHVQVPAKTKELIDKFAAVFGCSQGEAVALIAAAYQKEIKRTLEALREHETTSKEAGD